MLHKPHVSIKRLFHVGKILFLMDKSWISSKLYDFFPTSFPEWVQLILLVVKTSKLRCINAV